MDNPSSQLEVTVRVAGSAPPPPSVATRGIAIVAGDTQPVPYRIRRSGVARIQQNSLQLEVVVSSPSYLTIVDVDSGGVANLLFPNDYQQRSFYPDGLVPGSRTLLIPDSLQPGNQAGFYWDYSPPKGIDTIRVFASTDLQTAQMIRQRVRALQTAAARTRGGMTTRAVSSVVGNRRQELARVATRGLITVYDPTSHIPAEQNSALVEQSSSQNLLDPSSAGPMIVGGDESTLSPNAADWAAVSLTVVVNE